MITRIDITIYNTSVAILVEINAEELKDFYEDNKDILTYEEYNDSKKDAFVKGFPGITLHTDSNNFLVYLKNGKSDNIVAHEIFHVCNKILVNRNVTFDEDAEAWAYLIGWFTEEYYRRYWEFKDTQESILS